MPNVCDRIKYVFFNFFQTFFLHFAGMNSLMIYRDINEKIEQLTNIFAKAFYQLYFCLVVPYMVYTMIDYYVLDTVEKSFYFFYPTWWPFDWKTPSGYLMAWVGQCAGVGTIITIPITFFNTVFGSKWLFMVIAEDITNDLAAFNSDTVKKLNESNRAGSMTRFCAIIQLYTNAKL